jgi:hypothetical protein
MSELVNYFVGLITYRQARRVRRALNGIVEKGIDKGWHGFGQAAD